MGAHLSKDEASADPAAYFAQACNKANKRFVRNGEMVNIGETTVNGVSTHKLVPSMKRLEREHKKVKKTKSELKAKYGRELWQNSVRSILQQKAEADKPAFMRVFDQVNQDETASVEPRRRKTSRSKSSPDQESRSQAPNRTKSSPQQHYAEPPDQPGPAGGASRLAGGRDFWAGGAGGARKPAYTGSEGGAHSPPHSQAGAYASPRHHHDPAQPPPQLGPRHEQVPSRPQSGRQGVEPHYGHMQNPMAAQYGQRPPPQMAPQQGQMSPSQMGPQYGQMGPQYGQMSPQQMVPQYGQPAPQYGQGAHTQLGSQHGQVAPQGGGYSQQREVPAQLGPRHDGQEELDRESPRGESEAGSDGSEVGVEALRVVLKSRFEEIKVFRDGNSLYQCVKLGVMVSQMAESGTASAEVAADVVRRGLKTMGRRAAAAECTPLREAVGHLLLSEPGTFAGAVMHAVAGARAAHGPRPRPHSTAGVSLQEPEGQPPGRTWATFSGGMGSPSAQALLAQMLQANFPDIWARASAAAAEMSAEAVHGAVNAYTAIVLTDKMPGGLVELQALSLYFHCPVIVYVSIPRPPYPAHAPVVIGGQEPGAPITLWEETVPNAQERHYRLLIARENNHPDSRRTPPRTPPGAAPPPGGAPRTPSSDPPPPRPRTPSSDPTHAGREPSSYRTPSPSQQPPHSARGSPSPAFTPRTVTQRGQHKGAAHTDVHGPNFVENYRESSRERAVHERPYLQEPEHPERHMPRPGSGRSAMPRDEMKRKKSLKRLEMPDLSHEDRRAAGRAMRAAALGGSSRAVQKHLQRGVSQEEAIDEEGNSLLHIACTAGDKRLFKVTLKYTDIKGQPPRSTYLNLANCHGETPLLLATKNGHTKLAQQLLARGAHRLYRNQTAAGDPQESALRRRSSPAGATSPQYTPRSGRSPAGSDGGDTSESETESGWSALSSCEDSMMGDTTDTESDSGSDLNVPNTHGMKNLGLDELRQLEKLKQANQEGDTSRPSSARSTIMYDRSDASSYVSDWASDVTPSTCSDADSLFYGSDTDSEL